MSTQKNCHIQLLPMYVCEISNMGLKTNHKFIRLSLHAMNPTTVKEQ